MYFILYYIILFLVITHLAVFTIVWASYIVLF